MSIDASVIDPAPLRVLPDAFAATRSGLHSVAEQVVAPARKPDNEISLRATPSGFGTPVFQLDGVPNQVRVEGAELVHAVGEQERRAELVSLAAAAALVAGLIPPGTIPSSTPLEIDAPSSLALGAWFEFGNCVLETLRSDAGSEDDPSDVSLWPEHFDIAIELGNEASGRRANFGLSPGDTDHRAPYLYVGPWRGEVSGELWNAGGFSGAELSYAELLAADDQLALALDFCRTRIIALESMEAGN